MPPATTLGVAQGVVYNPTLAPESFVSFALFRMSSIPAPPNSSDSAVNWRALRASVERGMLRERASLRGRMKRLEDASRGGNDKSAEIGKLLSDVQQSESQARQRQARLPKVTYPEELPISTKRDEIAAAIRSHQVVIVCGETGSGKTTQLPKICLDLGRGVQGMIGHTQPRRIAARAVAARVARALHTPRGEAVGFPVRFTVFRQWRSHILSMASYIVYNCSYEH